jgi:hypothetical protein
MITKRIWEDGTDVAKWLSFKASSWETLGYLAALQFVEDLFIMTLQTASDKTKEIVVRNNNTELSRYLICDYPESLYSTIMNLMRGIGQTMFCSTTRENDGLLAVLIEIKTAQSDTVVWIKVWFQNNGKVTQTRHDFKPTT